MKRTQFGKQLAAAAGLLLVSAIPDRSCGQSLPPASVETPLKTIPSVRAKRAPDPMDDFAGLSFSDDQKVKIQQIRKDIESRMNAVVRDDKLSPDQKGAMLQGFQRMERTQVYQVLTPEQQLEVRRKILARRKAAKEEKEKQQSPRPQPFPQPPSGR
jgi:hypothetical protein